MKVMEAAAATEELLKEKAVALGAIRAEFERKQKEVSTYGKSGSHLLSITTTGSAAKSCRDSADS